MGKLTDYFFKSVGQHFVTLSCVQRTPSDSEEKVFILSGFLVDVHGMWFYVTAGHILKRIRTAIESGSTFDVWRFDDQTAGNRFKGVAVPYAFNIEDWLVIEDLDIGLDYAAVPIGGLYRAQLAAGGTKPIGRYAWGDHVTKHDFWALVGVPSETVDYDHETTISAKVIVAPVTPADEPKTAEQKAQNQFYAKLADDSAQFVRDIDGMSGGPIFAITKSEGTWKYTVIGVQSAWYRSIRTIAACPFSSFGHALEDVVREAHLLADSQSTAGPCES